MGFVVMRILLARLVPAALTLTVSAASFGADVYGPAPFHELLESRFTDIWSPAPISDIENRRHVLLLDATQSFALSIDETTPTALTVTSVSDLTGGTSTYGTVVRSMFQILDLNAAVLAAEDLSGTYTVHPELLSYYAIDADADAGSARATALTVRDRGSFYMRDQSTVAYLVFTMTGTASSTPVQATSRYAYDDSEGAFVRDAAWSSSQWLVIDGSSVGLTSTASEATEFLLADARDLVDIGLDEGSDFNPDGTEWQTNSFAGFPIDPDTGEVAAWDYDDSQLNTDLFDDVDTFYQTQFGAETSAQAAAAQALDAIEIALASQGHSMRYDKSVYLAFRENALSHLFGAVDVYNAKLDQRTVAHVYFTNAEDDEGEYHPFMVIGAHNAPAGPNFLIDVPRPPGDGEGDTYEEQAITRSALLEHKLVRIPLRDYAESGDDGLITDLTDNDLTSYGSLADDEGLDPSEYDVYNYASVASSGVAANGTVIYPASNNTLMLATATAEVTSTGAHVGRGLGLHYHADGHGFNGNGINLYNLSDYEGRDHPPIVAFAYDGIALYGKYEPSHRSMDGYSVSLDQYGGHDHGDYGYHYHAFALSVTQTDDRGDTIGPFEQHFLLVGAWRGKVDSIPGLLQLSTSQFKDDEIKRYVGATGTVTVTVPVIFGQPRDTAIDVGDSATLSVTAMDAEAYQWYTGTSGDTGSPIAGETGPSLTVRPLATTPYWVRVASVDWVVDSDTATVSVDTSACEIDLSAETVTGTVTHETCLAITAGSDYVVASSGDLTLRAGLIVALGPGFEVEPGGLVAVEVDSELLP